MKTIKYWIIGTIAFVLLWQGTHLHIALALVGAPSAGILFGWLYEKAFPHAYDSIVKDDANS